MRFVPSLKSWFFALSVLLLGFFVLEAASLPISYADIFWQIKAGELFLSTQSLKVPDPFSWSAAGKIWFDFEWLIQIGFYLLHSWGGFFLIRIFFALLWVTGVSALFVGLKHYFKSNAHAFSLVCLFVCLGFWQFVPAPRTVGMFIGIFFTLLWQPWNEKVSVRRLTVAALVFWLWCNIHPESTVWLGLVGLHAALGWVQKRSCKSRWLFFMACTGLSVLTPHITALYPTLWNWGKICAEVDEVVPLYQSYYISWPGKLLFSVIAVSWLTTLSLVIRREGWKRYVNSPELFFDIVAFLFLILGMKHGRFIWMAMVPTILGYHRLLKLGPRLYGLGIFQPILSLLLVCLFTGWSPLYARALFSKTYFQRHFREGTLPIGAADFLLKNPLPGKMYSHYIWGGYLIYRLYPKYRVFVDGRTLFYPEEILNDENKISSGAPETPQLLDKYGFDFLVVAPNYFSEATAKQLKWKLRYRDRSSSVYVRASSTKY